MWYSQEHIGQKQVTKANPIFHIFFFFSVKLWRKENADDTKLNKLTRASHSHRFIFSATRYFVQNPNSAILRVASTKYISIVEMQRRTRPCFRLWERVLLCTSTIKVEVPDYYCCITSQTYSTFYFHVFCNSVLFSSVHSSQF